MKKYSSPDNNVLLSSHQVAEVEFDEGEAVVFQTGSSKHLKLDALETGRWIFGYYMDGLELMAHESVWEALDRDFDAFYEEYAPGQEFKIPASGKQGFLCIVAAEKVEDPEVQAWAPKKGKDGWLGNVAIRRKCAGESFKLMTYEDEETEVIQAFGWFKEYVW